MDEQRRHNRYILENGNVTSRMQLATEVNLLDISLSGASIITDKRLNIGGRYVLKILSGDTSLPLHSEAVWEQLVSSERKDNGDVVPMYKAGLKFDSVLTGDGAKLLELISSTITPAQMYPRLGGLRIRIDNGSASIGTTEISRVKEISIGGMVVEATASLEPDVQVTLELFLHEEEALSLVCRVTSCAPSKELQGSNVIGFEFLEMGLETHSRLSEFISSLNGSSSK